MILSILFIFSRFQVTSLVSQSFHLLSSSPFIMIPLSGAIPSRISNGPYSRGSERFPVWSFATALNLYHSQIRLLGMFQVYTATW